jgi:hypothetical protein
MENDEDCTHIMKASKSGQDVERHPTAGQRKTLSILPLAYTATHFSP